jgi:hypothetical protein
MSAADADVQTDIVENVLMEDLSMVRLPASVQPNMQNGVRPSTPSVAHSTHSCGS